MQILGIFAGREGFDLFDEGFPLGVAAVADLGALGAVGFQHVDGLGLAHVQPLVLGHKVFVHPLPQVVVAVVFAVDVHDDRPPGLMDHRGVQLLHQPALHAVHHAGAHAVVAAVAQHEVAVLGVFPVGEQLAVDIFAAKAGLGHHLEGFLGHIQAVLAHDAKLHPLAEHRFAGLFKHFGVGLHPHLLLLHQGVYGGGILEGEGFIGFEVDALARGEDTRFLVPQAVGLRDQAHHGQGEVGFEHVGGAYDGGGLLARLEGPGADGCGISDDEGAGVQRAAGDGGHGAVLGIIHRGSGGHIESNRHVGVVEAAGGDEGGSLRKAPEARAVHHAGRGRVIIKKAAQAEGAAITVIRGDLRQIQLVQHVAGGIGQGEGLATGAGELEGGVIAALGVHGVLAVQRHQLVFPGPDHRALGKLPLAGPVDVVADAPAGKIDGFGAAVVDLHPVLLGAVDGHLVVAGHHLGEDHVGAVQGPQVFVRPGRAGFVVGRAGGGQGVDLPSAGHVVAAIAAIHGQVAVHHPIHQLGQGVGQGDGFTLGGQSEIGVGIAGLGPRAILAGAEHDVVLAGVDESALGEEPLGEFLLVVAQGVIGQHDALAARVVQLDPVAELAVLIAQAAAGRGHDLVDAQGVGLDGVAAEIGYVAVLGVGIAGAVQAGDLKGAVLHAGVGLVGVQGGELHAVDGVARGIEQEHRVADGGKLELGMIGPVGLVLVGVVAKDDDALARFQIDVRENELGLVAAVGQGDILERNGAAGGVHDLHPVAEAAAVVRQGRAVGRHDLADHQTLVRARALAPRVEGLLYGLPGADHHHENKEQQKQHHQRGAKIIPALAARGGFLTSADNLRHVKLL